MSIVTWFWRAIVAQYDRVESFLRQLLYGVRQPVVRPSPRSHQCPPALKYHRRQGSWRRKLLPALPDHAFLIPEQSTIPYGEIYYLNKGHYIGMGATSFVDRLESGNVIKYPIPNPYCPEKENECRQQMAVEAEAYKRIGNSARIPRLIQWNASSCCLVLEYLQNGDLRSYMENQRFTTQQKDIWTTQAAEALAAVHAAEVIHCDVTPRNFLLNERLDLHIADFAGSSIAGSRPMVTTSPRFQRPGWSRWEVRYVDDIFALGSVLYFIQTGHEPYNDITEEEVRDRFDAAEFPDVSSLRYGNIIRGCWVGDLSNAQQVVDALDLPVM